MFTAEDNYFFRHALVRDAAYDLQLPSERASAHKLAFLLIEQAFGGRAPEPWSLGASDTALPSVHPIESVALELAEHLKLATVENTSTEIDQLQKVYLMWAACHAERTYKLAGNPDIWQKILELADEKEKAECRRRLARAFQYLGDIQGAIENYQLALDTYLKDDIERLAHVTKVDIAQPILISGDVELAEKYLTDSLAFFRSKQHIRDIQIVLSALAVVYMTKGKPELAKDCLIEATTGIYVESGVAENRYKSLTRLAVVYGQLGKQQEAKDILSELLEYHHRAGHRREEGIAYANLGLIGFQCGEMAQAERHIQQALAIHREVGDVASESTAQINLALVFHSTGRLDEAMETQLRAVSLNRELGNTQQVGIALGNLGELFLDLHDFEQAEKTIIESIAIHQEVGNRRSEGMALVNLARVFLKTGREALGEQTLIDSLQIHEEVSNQGFVGTTKSELAVVFSKSARTDLAEKYFQEALEILKETNNAYLAAIPECAYGLHMVTTGRPGEGRARWLKGARALEKMGDSVALQQVKAEMREVCNNAEMEPFDRSSE